MPLPADVLENISSKIEEARKKRAELQEVLDDLRASGVDANAQREKAAQIDEQLKQLSIFYKRQMKRVEG